MSPSPEPARPRRRAPNDAGDSPAPTVSPAEVPVREIVEQLVASGAIMTRPGTPLVRELVGALQWGHEDTVVWFTAFGENQHDGHLLRFERIEIHPVGACFCQGSSILAFLAPIEKAAVDDVDDYRIAWRLWHEVLPLREPAIARVFEDLLQPARGSRSPYPLIDGFPHPAARTR